MAQRTAVPRYRRYDGPPLFRQGYRPFFLAAGVWAAAAVPLWLLVFQGDLGLASAFDPVAWHAHEMIFGFAVAAVAGFLLTAIPNWTGGLPLQGPPLIGLFGLWVAGRIAVACSGAIGAGPAAAIDGAFLVVLLLVALREIVAGRNWRNLPMLLALALLITANLLAHFEAIGWIGTTLLGARLGIATLVVLIGLIGGRIIPSFTRNWLVKQGATALPAPFGPFDRLCVVVTLLALVGWVFAEGHPASGAALVVAGGLNLARLSRWQGQQTLSEPLVWSLHLGYLWVPLGLLLLGVGVAAPQVLSPTAGLHALTAGAVGGMTLAVMTRATLGHSGRGLEADPWTSTIYLAVAAAALLRVVASAIPALSLVLLWVSGLAWFAGFALFAVRYGRMHLGR